MQDSGGSVQAMRFGAFEVDLRAGELRKHGLRIRLQDQPFQLLALLLEHPGEVVSREEVQQKLWPSDTFVDFDHGLNNAINRLREALADSAENPHYIETLPKRGYRFTAPVDVVSSPAAVAAKPPGLANKWLVAGALAGAVGLVLALNPGHVRSRLLGRPNPASIHSLAVLPLENLSGDAAQDYFAQGMTDELTGELAHISALKVISRTSAVSVKGSKKTIPEIARELGVDAVIEGGVLRSGDRVRISAQLIHGSTDQHLWARTYERDLGDVLTLQSDVARAISAEIQAKLTAPERARLASARPVNPEAYELYLLGRFYWNKRTVPDTYKSIDYFQQALQKDPNFALAYAGLAEDYKLLGFSVVAVLPSAEAAEKSKAAARKALELDDSLAEAHAALGDTLWRYDWNWEGAGKEFRRAIELNPGYATAYHWYAFYLHELGQSDESMAAIRRAQQLDPVSPNIARTVGLALSSRKQYDQAIAELRRAIELDPTHFNTHETLGSVYIRMGRFPEGFAELEKADQMSGGSLAVRSFLAWAYARGGRKRDAEKLLAELLPKAKRGYLAVNIAYVYMALGRKDDAIGWLEKGVDEHASGATQLKAPDWEPLRSDPRFQALLHRMGLPPDALPK